MAKPLHDQVLVLTVCAENIHQARTGLVPMKRFSKDTSVSHYDSQTTETMDPKEMGIFLGISCSEKENYQLAWNLLCLGEIPHNLNNL